MLCWYLQIEAFSWLNLDISSEHLNNYFQLICYAFSLLSYKKNERQKKNSTFFYHWFRATDRLNQRFKVLRNLLIQICVNECKVFSKYNRKNTDFCWLEIWGYLKGFKERFEKIHAPLTRLKSNQQSSIIYFRQS